MKSQNLTKKELEVYDLWISLNLSAKQISIRRKTTLSATYKHLRNIKKKGYDKSEKIRSSKLPMHSIMPTGKKYFRLHNLHLKVTPYYYYDRYKKNIGKPIFLGKWIIHVNTYNLEFQTKKKQSFDHKNIDKANNLARENLYYDIIPKIEERTGCEIIKDDKLNIKLVNHHIAEVRNGVAKLVEDKKLKILDDDGKVWVIIDKSLKTPELETVDPILAIDDQKLLQRHFNDLRKHDPMTNYELQLNLSDIVKTMQKIVDTNLETATRTNVLADHMASHGAFTNVISRIANVKLKEVERIKKQAGQTKLTKF